MDSMGELVQEIEYYYSVIFLCDIVDSFTHFVGKLAFVAVNWEE